jgi:hypothetical protein
LLASATVDPTDAVSVSATEAIRGSGSPTK